jgi:atypical dual specificity phosphatase
MSIVALLFAGCGLRTGMLPDDVSDSDSAAPLGGIPSTASAAGGASTRVGSIGGDTPPASGGTSMTNSRSSSSFASGGATPAAGTRASGGTAAAPGFSWVMRDKLAGMAHPGTGAALDAALSYLAWKGISLLISLTTDPVDSATAQAHGITVLHLPIPDFTAPTQQQIVQFVAAASSMIANGGAVAVQCSAGMGRTGTMLACYFVSDGMAADQAIAHVRELRPGSVETEAQVQAVRDYAASLGR